MKIAKISTALILLNFIIGVYVGPAGAVTCSDVVKQLRPCLKYLMSGSGPPPTACCTGVSALASITSSSVSDKIAACECIKSTSKNLKMNDQLAKDLPNNCGITLSFDVSPNVDCSTVG